MILETGNGSYVDVYGIVLFHYFEITVVLFILIESTQSVLSIVYIMKIYFRMVPYQGDDL